MEKLIKIYFTITSSKYSWLALATVALSLQCAALFFQYGLKLEPCLLCIYQRVAIWGMFFAGIIGFIFPSSFPRFFAFGLWASCSFKGLILANELNYIQQNPSELTTCSFFPNFPSFLPLHKLMPFEFMPTGLCGIDQWDFLGLSMAQWMIIIFFTSIVIATSLFYGIVFASKKKCP